LICFSKELIPPAPLKKEGEVARVFLRDKA